VRPVVAVVGAFDRFNFGDLLFPHVIRSEFDRLGVDAVHRYYSIRGADLRHRGGVDTRPLTVLGDEPLPRGSLVVVAGGELLTARWSDAYAGLAGPRRTLASKIAARLVGAEPVDLICRRLLGGDRPLPWVLDAKDLGQDAPVSYNGVGGIGIESLPPSLRAAARSRLSRAAFLGVRDPETRRGLVAWDLGLDIRLTPDCAVLAPGVFSREVLEGRASEETRAAVARFGKGYAVIQTGRYPAWGRVGVLADQIRLIHRETGLGVLLLPLGQAPGHEDLHPLRRVAELLEGLPVALLPQPDVDDIVVAISSARLFVGSSLHGSLIAMVYGVPHVGFGERVRKLDLMLRTWDPASAEGAVEATSIAARSLNVIGSDHSQLSEKLAELQATARASFEEQARLLNQ
jgi:hypothetical protein